MLANQLGHGLLHLPGCARQPQPLPQLKIPAIGPLPQRSSSDARQDFPRSKTFNCSMRLPAEKIARGHGASTEAAVTAPDHRADAVERKRRGRAKLLSQLSQTCPILSSCPQGQLPFPGRPTGRLNRGSGAHAIATQLAPILQRREFCTRSTVQGDSRKPSPPSTADSDTLPCLSLCQSEELRPSTGHSRSRTTRNDDTADSSPFAQAERAIEDRSAHCAVADSSLQSSAAPWSLTCKIEAPKRSIDDQTEIPEELFNSMLKLAAKVSCSGQHQLMPKAGPQKLVRADLMPQRRFPIRR
eukprot:gb/GFBE01014509.1/.p1 GENE.gb/GFBE01014509.1/~~gb/GFBE01014509.1/.p1  ORF type:complete len:299 (+),score=24.49 gb/GFBE01014509.1/:1-897(+)